jgi:ASC-1-like (ASCH) protein
LPQGLRVRISPQARICARSSAVEHFVYTEGVFGSNPNVRTMANHLLRFAKDQQKLFYQIETGQKTVETRAGSPAYQSIKVGDQLTFVCQKQRILRLVKEVKRFASIDELLHHYPVSQIMPDVITNEEATKIYYSFPNYRERIANFGLLAFELEWPKLSQKP